MCFCIGFLINFFHFNKLYQCTHLGTQIQKASLCIITEISYIICLVVWLEKSSSGGIVLCLKVADNWSLFCLL